MRASVREASLVAVAEVMVSMRRCTRGRTLIYVCIDYFVRSINFVWDVIVGCLSWLGPECHDFTSPRPISVSPEIQNSAFVLKWPIVEHFIQISLEPKCEQMKYLQVILTKVDLVQLVLILHVRLRKLSFRETYLFCLIFWIFSVTDGWSFSSRLAPHLNAFKGNDHCAKRFIVFRVNKKLRSLQNDPMLDKFCNRAKSYK